jgi:hypothetical protein
MENKPSIELPDNKRKSVAKEDQEFEHWSHEFGISKDELVTAVQSGKTPAEAVEKYVKEVNFSI